MKQYSGPKSKDVWDRIHAIKHPCLRSAVYVFGCAMQEMENRFWQALTDAELPESKLRIREIANAD